MWRPFGELPVAKHGVRGLANCVHKGLPIQVLLDQLHQGIVKPSALPCLVVARWKGQLWVVYGNRRLQMLRWYAGSVAHQVRARVEWSITAARATRQKLVHVRRAHHEAQESYALDANGRAIRDFDTPRHWERCVDINSIGKLTQTRTIELMGFAKVSRI